MTKPHTYCNQMAVGVRTLVSLVAAYSYWYAIMATLARDLPITRSFGGIYMFLTNLGVCMSLIQQVLSLVADVTGLRLAAALSNVALLVSAPLELLITTIYWPIKFYNGALLMDPKLGIKIAPWLDRQLHLYPAIYQTICAVSYPHRRWVYGNLSLLVLYSSFALGYFWWTSYLAEVNGFYPYPLLSLLSGSGTLALYSVCAVLCFGSAKFIQKLQNMSQH